MSGHYATLLRGTVRDMLPDHDIYITDWIDAREVPLGMGEFDLDDYTDYLIAMIEALSGEGERIAVLPLAPAARNPGVTRLLAPIAPWTGTADLCVTYTARGPDPLWAVAAIQLVTP